MLYTSYIGNIKNVPKNVPKLIITRLTPLTIDIDGRGNNTWLIRELSPSEEIFYKYKQTGDWDSFVESFNKQMSELYETKNFLVKLASGLDRGNDYCLICYEKNHKKCHRNLIAIEMRSRGYEVTELKH